MSSKIRKWVSSQKGLTLTELLVAISIVMILALVGVTTFSSSLPRYRLNGTARDIVSDMRLARQQAATENWQYAIQFLDSTSYNVVRGEDQPLLQSSTSRKTVKSGKANTGVSWAMPATMPVFQPNGLIGRWDPSSNIVSAGAPSSIDLNDSHGNTKTVVIGATGRIRIQ